MRNFTVVDTLGTLKACAALLPFMFAPGYVAGWALDLFEFRQRRPILRLILAVPLSIAICPMLSYLLARFVEPGLWVFYLGVFAACILLLAKDVRRARLRPVAKYIWVALGLAAVWERQPSDRWSIFKSETSSIRRLSLTITPYAPP